MNQAISLEFVLSETSEEVLVLVLWAEPEQNLDAVLAAQFW